MQQACRRALFSLRGAWSASGPAAARSFSEAAAGGAPLSKAAEAEGAKSKLFRILGAVQEPLTSAQVWEAAEPLGLRSKRFTKLMLQQLRDAGWVKTQPMGGAKGGKKHKSFGYRLNPAKQQQREASLAARQAPGAAP